MTGSGKRGCDSRVNRAFISSDTLFTDMDDFPRRSPSTAPSRRLPTIGFPNDPAAKTDIRRHWPNLRGKYGSGLAVISKKQSMMVIIAVINVQLVNAIRDWISLQID